MSAEPLPSVGQMERGNRAGHMSFRTGGKTPGDRNSRVVEHRGGTPEPERGKSGPPGGQERVRGDAEHRRVMEPSPTSSVGYRNFGPGLSRNSGPTPPPVGGGSQ